MIDDSCSCVEGERFIQQVASMHLIVNYVENTLDQYSTAQYVNWICFQRIPESRGLEETSGDHLAHPALKAEHSPKKTLNSDF